MTEPITQGAAFRAQTGRSFYGDPPLFDQAIFGIEQKPKMDEQF